MPTYRGCRGIAVEPISEAKIFTRLSTMIIGWTQNEFVAVNTAVSNREDKYVWFDVGKITTSENNTDITDKVRVPLTTLDVINDQYVKSGRYQQSQVAYVIKDVEGYEQEVLLGAKNLIAQRSVIGYQIEVWTSHEKRSPVIEFPGLQLLIDNSYRLFTFVQNSKLNIRACSELTNHLVELPSIFNETCQVFNTGRKCLGEICATRNDFPSMQHCFDDCPKYING